MNQLKILVRALSQYRAHGSMQRDTASVLRCPSSQTWTARTCSSQAVASPEAQAEKKFSCSLCAKLFLTKSALDSHMVLRHSQRNPGKRQGTAAGAYQKPQSFQSLIDGYEATHIERIDKRRYSKHPLIIDGKPETEEERKARLRKVIEEREQQRHKSVSVTDIPLVLDLVSAWDTYALNAEEDRNNDLEEGEYVPPPYIKYTPVTIDDIKAYIKRRREELGYDEDAVSWTSDGIPLSVFKSAAFRKNEKQNAELQKIHFGSRQLGGMTEENPYKKDESPETVDLPFKCPNCGKGYRSKMSMEFHFTSICKSKGGEEASTAEASPAPASEAASTNDAPKKETFVEGPLYEPIYASPEVREMYRKAEDYEPVNPFTQIKKEDKVDLESLSDEWQIQENLERVIKEKADAAIRHENEPEHLRPLAQTSAPSVQSGSESYMGDANDGKVKKVQSIPTPVVRTSSSAPNPFAKKAATSSIPQKADAGPERAATPSKQAPPTPPAASTMNPFKQAALQAKALKDAGKPADNGFADPETFKAAMDKIPAKQAEPVEKKPNHLHAETCNEALNRTFSKQPELLRNFTSRKPVHQNPFKMFSAARDNPQVPSASPSVNVQEPKSVKKPSNPFAHFSAKSTETLQKPSVESPGTTRPINTQKPPVQQAKPNPFNLPQNFSSSQRTPASSPKIANLFAQKPATATEQHRPINPFASIPTPRSTVGASQQSAATVKQTKPTCPQCGLTFRLQAALDSHIASSHTVASSLYSDTEVMISSDENPYQPGGVVPVIPADPFAV